MDKLLSIFLNFPDDPQILQQEALALSILTFSQTLADTWETIVKQPIIAEDLIALTIELLPDNLKILQKADKILFEASSYEVTGEAAYAITTLYAAIHVKLTEKLHSQLVDNNIILVSNEIKNREELKSLRALSNQYRIFLYHSIKAIVDSDKILSIYYSRLNEEDFIYFIIEDIKQKFIEAPLKKPLNFYIEKYLFLNDMIITLIKNHIETFKIQLEFAEKFLKYKEVFSKKQNNFFNFFKSKTIEDDFLELAQNFTKKIKEKEGALEFNL